MKTITEDGEVIDEVTFETIAIAPPYFKTNWNHDTTAEANSCALECKDPSKTQQQFLKDADINNILRKFLDTGELALTGPPSYQTFNDLVDLQDTIVTKHQVDEAWAALPAAVRNILKDPKTFADYVDHCVTAGDINPLRELGLTPPLARPEPPKPTGQGTPAPNPAESPSGAPKPPTEVKTGP